MSHAFGSVVALLSTVLQLTSSHPILVVVSFDGFRSDYVRPELTPTLHKLAQYGVKAHMMSSFVTKTYPNHQTIATGYYEEYHGIVNNEMFDSQYNETFLPTDIDRSANKWWDEKPVLPIWIANQMVDSTNRYSGSMQWPGSHVKYRNQTIKYLHGFDDGMTWDQRIDKMIDWMTAPTEAANCVFAYFDEPDATAHEYGPFSDEVYAKVKLADKTIARLLKRLEETGLLSHTNLIVLSDHGMAEIRSERVIKLNDFLNASWYDMYGASPVWSIQPKPGFEDKVFQTLFNASKTMNFTVYKKEDIPQEYHYKNHRRILPIFLLADEGWDIFRNMTWTLKGGNVWGNHGYNNSLPSMQPLFIASGPAFKSGYNHAKPFINVDLYPLMLRVLQLFPTTQFPSNGSLTNVWDLLIPPIYSEDYDTSTQKWFNLILYVFGGFGVLFFGSVCLICSTNVRKSLRKSRPPDIVWDSLGNGLDIDLRSHLGPDVHDFSKPFDDDIINRAKRLQRPEETLLLLEDDDEEDL